MTRPQTFLTIPWFNPRILSNYMFWWGGVRPAVLTFSPYNYRGRICSDRGIYSMELREYNDNVAVELDFVHALIITQYTNSKIFHRPVFLSNRINQVKAACSCEHHTHTKWKFHFSFSYGRRHVAVRNVVFLGWDRRKGIHVKYLKFNTYGSVDYSHPFLEAVTNLKVLPQYVDSVPFRHAAWYW
jgi:hypothetical protein